MMVLDTNIVISYLKEEKRIADWVEEQILKGVHLALSTMTVVELLGYPNLKPEEQFLIEQLLQSVLVVDVDISLAREASRIRRTMKLKAIDSVIAATAVLLHAPLVTHDIVFKKIRDIEVITP